MYRKLGPERGPDVPHLWVSRRVTSLTRVVKRKGKQKMVGTGVVFTGNQA